MKRVKMLMFILLAMFCFIARIEATEENYSISGFDENGVLNLDFNENNSKEIIFTAEEGYSIYTEVYNRCCNITKVDETKFVVTPKNYGKYNWIFSVTTPEGIITKSYYVDVDSENYLNRLLDKIPNTIYSSKAYYYGDFSEYITINDVSVRNKDCTSLGNNSYECTIVAEISNQFYNELTSLYEFEFTTKSKKVKYILNPIVINGYYAKLDVDDTQQLSLNLYNGDKNTLDYIWASDDNSVASVSNRGLLTAKGAGKTIIKVYNKKTFEYGSFPIEVVDNEITNIADFANEINNTTINIDIGTNELQSYLYSYGDINYETILNQVLNKKFNKLVSSKVPYLGLQNINCIENVCSGDMYSYEKNDYGSLDRVAATFNNVTINLTGFIISNYMSNIQFDYPLILSYFSDFLEESDTLNVIYDENYFTKNTDNQLVPIKTGVTTVTVISSSGYTATKEFKISYQNSESTVAKDYMDSLSTIELKYKENDFSTAESLKYLEKIISTYVVNNYPNEEIRDNLTAKVNCIMSSSCTISLLTKNNVVLKEDLKRVSKISYNNTNINIISNIKTLDNSIKEKYIIDSEKTLKLESETLNNNEFYNQLINHTNINAIISNSALDVTFERKSNTSFNNYINGSANYELTIKDGDVIVVQRYVTIYSNHVIDMAPNLSHMEEKRIEYVKNHIDQLLQVNCEVGYLDDNVYKITIGEKSFNIILDQKDKIKANYLSIINDRVAILKTNESFNLNTQVYPIDANSYELAYSSQNNKIATVNENGLVTGVSTGYTRIYVCISGEYSCSSVLVIVNSTLEAEMDKKLPIITDTISLNYGDLYDDDVENSLMNAIYRNYISYNDSELFNLIVFKEDDKYYYCYHVNDVYSKKIQIKYKYEGIKIDDRYFSLDIGEKVDSGLSFVNNNNDDLQIYIENPAIVSFDKNGIITGKKAGSTYVNVSDKYGVYHNYFEVFVDFNDYITDVFNQLKSEPIPLIYEHCDYSGCDNYQNDLYNIIWEKVGSFGDSRTADVSCNKTTNKCLIEFYDYNIGEYFRDPITIDFIPSGIVLDEKFKNLVVDDYYNLDYTLLNDTSNVTIKTLSDNCSVNDGVVTALKPGFCNIKLKSNKYFAYQHLLINTDDYISRLNEKANLLPKKVTLTKFLYNYDDSEDTNYVIQDIHYLVLTEMFEKIVGTNYDYDFNIEFDENEDLIHVRIEDNNSFDDKTDEYYNYDSENHVESDVVDIELIYEDLTSDEKALATQIKNAVKDKYVLSSMQFLKYKLAVSENGFWNVKVVNYTDLASDIAKICPTCKIENYSRAGDGGVDFIYEETTISIKNKNNKVLFSGDITIDGKFKVEIEEELTEEKFIELLKDEVRKAYLEYKKTSDEEPILQSTTTSTDDLEIEVSKEFNRDIKSMVYKFVIDDYVVITPIEVVLGDALVSGKPTLSVENRSYNSNKININKISGVSTYYLYRATSKTGTYTKIATLYASKFSTSTMTYLDKSLAFNKNYYYKVKVKKDGKYLYSDVKNIKTYFTSAPVITGYDNYYKYAKITINKVLGAQGYYIYRKDVESTDYVYIGKTTSTTYYDKTAKEDVVYSYKVKAYRYASGNKYSEFSNEITAKRLNDTITFTAETNSYSSIKLNINKIENATKYYVYRATSKTGTYTKIATLYASKFTEDNMTYIDSAKTFNKTYYYKVVAVYKNESDYSSYKAAKAYFTTVPSLTGSQENYRYNTITIGKVIGAQGYYIYRSENESTGYKYIGKTTSTTYYDKTANEDVTYYYKAKAYRYASGNKYSDYSASVTAKRLNDTITFTAVSNNYNSVLLTINKIENVNTYYVYRATSKSGKYTLVKTLLASDFNEDDNIAYVNDGLSFNKIYFYKIKVKNVNVSDYSVYKYARTSLKAPSMSIKVGGSYMTTNITINKVDYATAYEIYRSKEENGTYELLKTTSTLEYGYELSPSEYAENKTYYYKARAYRNVNGLKKYSVFSTPQLFTLE